MTAFDPQPPAVDRLQSARKRRSERSDEMVSGWFRKDRQPAPPPADGAASPAAAGLELTDQIHGEIKRLCTVGDRLVKRDELGPP